MDASSRELLLGAGASEAEMEALSVLATELLRWNARVNLTGYRDLRGVVVGLFLDALVLVPHLEGPRILDIGSGAGFPGLVLALARPSWSVTLLEARGKRVSFQKQAARLLGLGNVTCVQGRAGEGVLAGEVFDSVTCKAVTGLEGSLVLCRGYRRPGGLVVLPRGLGDRPAARNLGLPVMEYELPPPGGRRLLVVSRETSAGLKGLLPGLSFT